MILSPSQKTTGWDVSCELKSCTIASIVLVSIKTMIIIDIDIFCLWPIVSIWFFESMLAPRNQFATCIAYMKAMARLRV